jgi:hypothetical protein
VYTAFCLAAAFLADYTQLQIHHLHLLSRLCSAQGDEGVVIPDGTGVKLGEITNIAKSIQKADEDALKAVHSVLFGKGGKSATRKKNIRYLCCLQPAF